MDPHYQHLFCDHVIKSDFKTLSKSKYAFQNQRQLLINV